MAAKPASDRPPSITIHLIRHASSDYQEGGADFGLSSKGERQCDELYENMRKHAGYITNIFSSPMKRCVETARKGLLEATGRGDRIQIMPALAGRNGNRPWTLREENQEEDVSGPWVSEVADPRSKTKDADFVMGWLTGKDLSLQEAQKVLEVVVVSQAQLLQDLLWRIKGGRHGWPNATVFTYSLDDKGKWTH
ncbi:bb8e12af-0428-4ebb-a14d-7935e1a9f80d [Sclerotinia trifoliorum]|uniref:Bb8e12af-0428-4ebb-a14d-7935e1a9f80d n=1 Tax=Sclerotinia trifoliorum TaxID=28548 RepID=A0A8H2ZLR1_9HELO|nr:bb8e12af-0428-4ebb-a14d-7935e1a9f80d [Sclerotinia trifoliorum]